MPRDGSGNYTKPVSSVAPAVTNTVINPTDFNGLETDIATEMTDSLNRSGKGAMLAALNAGGFKVTNVGAPVAGTDAVRLTDIGGGAFPATSLVPTGALMDFAMNTAPAGWLECNGAAVSRATYAALFTAIGTAWGVGDGSTTFNLPDARGSFRRSWDHARGVDPSRAFASNQASSFASHTHIQDGHYHVLNDPGHGHSLSVFGTVSTLGTANGPQNSYVVGGSTPVANANTTGMSNQTTVATNQSTGGADTYPFNIAVLTCIKT
jgi:microcystin-dependent protein